MKQSLIYVAVLLLSLCSTASAKKKTDNPETVKLKSKIENVMLKVDAQPDWLYSRLQMFWNTHATDVFINGEQFDHPGGERAAEPTVKYNGTRGMETQYNRPKLEDILPYDDDEQGNVTYINKVTGKMEKTSPAKTGCNIASVNRQIMSVARDAALVYAATGEERYGRMAANVFEVYMKGIACRNVPVDLNHGHLQTLVGMTTFEVIHEDIITAYDMPWRYIMVGENPVDLINNKQMVLNLNAPCQIEDTSWIRPGKAFRVCRLDMKTAMEAVDFCTDRGLQYIELDAGWYGSEMKTAYCRFTSNGASVASSSALCR